MTLSQPDPQRMEHSLWEVLPALLAVPNMQLVAQWTLGDEYDAFALALADAAHPWPYESWSRAHDNLLDRFQNHAPVVRRMTLDFAREDEDVVDADICGYPGAYTVWVPEFDKAGFFTDINKAVGFLLDEHGEFIVDRDVRFMINSEKRPENADYLRTDAIVPERQPDAIDSPPRVTLQTAPTMIVDTITGVRKIHHWVGVYRVYYEGRCQGTDYLIGVPDKHGVSFIYTSSPGWAVARGHLSQQAIDSVKGLHETYASLNQGWPAT